MGEGGDDCGGGVGGEEVYSGNTEPALVLVLDSYSEDEEISVGDSGPSSSPPTHLLTTLSTGYCPKEIVCDFDLRRSFYTKPVF